MSRRLRRLGHATRIYDADFTTATLIVVGTVAGDGSTSMEQTDVGTPLGRSSRFCIACTPRRSTEANIDRTGSFTASYLAPEQLIADVGTLATIRAVEVEGALVADARGAVECRLEHVIRGSDRSLVIGAVVAVWAIPEATAGAGLFRRPLLASIPFGRSRTGDRRG